MHMCIGAPSLALIADILAYSSFSTLSSVVAAANAGSFYFSLPFSLEVPHVCVLCVCACVRMCVCACSSIEEAFGEASR